MPARGPYAKGIAKREEVLAQALALIGERGFHRTTLKDIADAVGVTEAAVLYHFGSKDALWVALMEKRDQLDEQTDWGTTDWPSRLAAVVRHNADVPGLVQMFVSLSADAASNSDHPAHRYFHDRYAGNRDLIAEDLRQMQADGTVRTDLPPTVLASLLLAISDGMQLQWQYDRSQNMGDHIQAALTLLQPPNA